LREIPSTLAPRCWRSGSLGLVPAEVGIVKVRTTGFNQDGTVVISFERTIMVYKKGHAPEITRLTPGKG
jgi:acyl dehydratase